MLSALLGNLTVERILLFLFVNGKGYGQELRRVFMKPLTPIQKGLERLEQGGILISYYEGRTRIYELNPGYPLIKELEALLKQAYTHLPSDEKKRFCVIRQKAASFSDPLVHFQVKRRQILLSFWEKLQEIQRLSFRAKSKAALQSSEISGWNGKGEGEVSVYYDSEGRLVFQEKGSWRGKSGEETSFTNAFRWTLDRKAEVISLEHLRRGVDYPVFLFHLTPVGEKAMASVDAHLCGNDTYFGQIHWSPKGLRLQWRVIGPKKNEEMEYSYTRS